MIKYEIEDGKEEFADIVVKGNGMDIILQSVCLIDGIAYHSKLNYSNEAAVEYMEKVITILMQILKQDYGKEYKPD